MAAGGYTNKEYVQILREKNTRPFLEDLRTTLMEVVEVFYRAQDDDETPRQFRNRRAKGLDELNRLLLRIQDGKTT